MQRVLATVTPVRMASLDTASEVITLRMAATVVTVATAAATVAVATRLIFGLTTVRLTEDVDTVTDVDCLVGATSGTADVVLDVPATAAKVVAWAVVGRAMPGMTTVGAEAAVVADAVPR